MEPERNEVTVEILHEQPNDAEGDDEDEEGRVNDRLKKFVKIFIRQFEEKLEEYSKEVKPGVKTQKGGQISEGVSGVITSVIPVVGGMGVDRAVDSLLNVPGSSRAFTLAARPLMKNASIYFGRRRHRKKAKKCIEILAFFQENKDESRKILAEAGFAIFRSFERQFSRITDREGSWRRGIEKLSMDAVNRLMNYIHKSTEKVELSSVFLTECIVLGESKGTIPTTVDFTIRGYSVRFEQSNTAFKTSELYSGTGLVRVEGEVLKYYREKQSGSTMKFNRWKGDPVERFGYRLALDWELEKWEKDLKHKYEINKCLSGGEYKYILKPESRETIVLAILEEMDDKDVLKVLKRTQKIEVDTNNTVKEMNEKLTVLSPKNEGLVVFNVTGPVESFAGRQEELQQLHTLVQSSSEKVTVTSRMTAITGLGGIGKTQLARRYVHEHGKNDDNNVLWVNAENCETLTESFLKLAGDKRVGIFTKDVNDKEKDIKSIVDEVYRFFAKGKSLFIFDNAERYSIQDKQDPTRNTGIVAFLPSSLKGYAHNPRFIITSWNQMWPEEVQILPLRVFVEKDAGKFIRDALKINDDQSDSEIAELAKKLEYLPLALQQAVAYIRVTNETYKITGSTFSIGDYLTEYEQVTKKLLDFRFPEDSNDSYHKTTLTTWTMIFDKIGENSQRILDIISYIAPDNIPVQIFSSLEFINNDREKLGEAVKQLLQYSLVYSGEEPTVINVHRLVQQVTRIKLAETNRSEDVVEVTFELLKKHYPHYSYKLEDHVLKRQVLPHLEAFLTHLDDWSVKNDEQKRIIEIDYITSLLKWMSDRHNSLSNPRRVKELLERALAIELKYYGADNSEVAGTLTSLGNVYGSLGDPQKQKELLESALKIKENQYDHDHFEIAVTLASLGNAHGSLRNYHEQKEFLERAVAIQEKHYGPKHFEVAKILTNLGNAYGSLGDHEKQLELLKRALAIERTHYGDHHFDVAITLTSLGNAYGIIGNRQAQKELLERAVKFREEHYGPEHFGVAITLANLGNAYGAFGDRQKQKELLERALVPVEKHHGSSHFVVASILGHLGVAYGSLGDHEKGKEYLERALEIQERHYGPDHVEVAKTLINLGTSYASLGNSLKQKQLFERALVIQNKYPDHPVLEIYEDLGNY